MTLPYTEEQRELMAAVREVARNEVAPHVAAADEAGACPLDLYQWGFDMGLHMVEIPEEYGGMGLSYETCAMLFEELAWADSGYADTFVTGFVAFRNILLAGTPAQARRFADVLAPGAFAAFCLTEAGAGSDVAALRTTAVLDGDEYVINGTKSFITNGSIASLYVVFAKTDPAAGARGITGFLVDGSAPGLSAGAKEHKMGFRLSDTCEVVFDNVRVPREAVIGEVGGGMAVALGALNLSRAFISTLAVGIMQRALDEAVAYARERRQFGRPIIEFEMVQAMLADMAVKCQASRAVVNNCMRLIDAGADVRVAGSVVKTFVTDALQEVTSNAVQVLGGYGYSKDYPVEKLMRDAKVFQIFEGTNQIQRLTIARELAKR
ncbi:acyl-CoA dehydrogenase family protein [Adlercreutzia mucosicola]|uniref:acyl-CoA dehydrogenase family protein n=1 Tax=Adlercreutzia mucosicola TaxID=580026 RepID=UPI002B247EDF|nr:acyl-CoA dehydrogenase family protein [Adlercreutzia mucosicola]MCI9495866.1 acyl-CoA dehydrogenase [Adlercreutzia mucosicola]MEB1814235.1 acyl-CoA dehydrogenase family protein [Adlercreutzia mucosicola]